MVMARVTAIITIITLSLLGTVYQPVYVYTMYVQVLLFRQCNTFDTYFDLDLHSISIYSYMSCLTGSVLQEVQYKQ